MTARMRLDTTSTILASQSIAVTTSSSVVELKDLEGASIQFNYSAGTGLTGSVSLYVSVDGVTYSEDPDSVQAITSNSGSHVYNIHDFHYPYIKCTFTRTAGDATMSMIFNGRARV